MNLYAILTMLVFFKMGYMQCGGQVYVCVYDVILACKHTEVTEKILWLAFEYSSAEVASNLSYLR